jgi:hypothetical protein
MQRAGIGLLTLGGGGILAFEANFAISSATANRTNPAYVLAIFLAIAGVAILLWGVLRNERVEAPPTASDSHQEGQDNVQAQASGGTAIAQRAESGGRNVVVQAGGSYYETERVSAKDDRVIVRVTPKDLTKLYSDHMTVEADQLFGRFKGHWMRVRGAVENISDHETFTTVTVGSFFDRDVVTMYFTKEPQRSRVLVKQQGEEIRILGRIDKAGGFSVDLEDCEIEE